MAVACAACATRGPAAPVPPTDAGSADRATITAMVEEFRRAITSKDGAALRALVVSDATPFVASYVGKHGPAHHDSTARDFIGEVTGSTHRLDERFAMVDVMVFDDLAVMAAAYSFHEDDQQTNHGRELWSLVRVGDGWQIAAVTWTVIVP
ncbi:MAG: nuclear transport factor 2 family protein [Kofleriaceae bacterium]